MRLLADNTANIRHNVRVEEQLIDIFRRGANDAWDLNLTPAQLDQFQQYADLLVEWNATRMNLTRLTSPRDIAVKHFLDSLSVLRVMQIPRNARLIDVGTGAGLPGLALKIVRPDIHLTLLDSTAKKLTFCRAVADALALTRVDILHARAEDAAKEMDHAHAYDVVTARAVASLAKLLPWTAPFLLSGGVLVAMKGANVDEEMSEGRIAAKNFGIKLEKPVSLMLPEAEEETERKIVLGRRV
ncbi:ribosomal RNA small subunit methyltransferase G [Capsulimonas corticalis]|uniref:Ribosomal RNA small subunit methyltransferase G n=1 Tax=Capsulimonas corticalis TaxID=2219043 RepID=A0A402D6G8_9BACT|nr:ribosomal RNA small subunit methyltransferase G [Capsulimonas corticalis]